YNEPVDWNHPRAKGGVETDIPLFACISGRAVAKTIAMNRREFLQVSAAGVALSTVGGYAAEFADQAPKRVGLIGTGWYVKCDLLRLIQVAPVEVVSLCDVDKKMLADAVELVSTRQKSKKKPRAYSDYREMLKEKDHDLVLVATQDHRHALAMIAAV